MVLLPLMMPDLGSEAPALLLLQVGRAGQEGRDLVLGLFLRRRVGVADEVVLQQRLRRVGRTPVRWGRLDWRASIKSQAT